MDSSPELASPDAAGVHAVRRATLISYNMFAYLDGDDLRKAVAFMQGGGKPGALKATGVVPGTRKPGALRSIFDGRYVFTRYFSTKQHNRPTTLEELRPHSDVELLDTEADPLELNNLAAGKRPNDDLVLALNRALDALIDEEVGDDRGQMLPGGAEAGWEVTAETMAP